MAKTDEKNKVLTEDTVAEMLGRLKRVESPNDFGIKVRAKIAERKAVPESIDLMHVFKLVMPAAALVILGSFLYFGGIFSSDVRDDAAIAVAEPKPIESESINTPAPITVNEVAAVNAEPPRVFEANTSRSNTRAVKRDREVIPVNTEQETSAPPEGGSYRQAITGSGTPIRPPGLSPESISRPDSRPEGFEGSRAVTGDELLSLFGIEAESSDSGMRVRNVREHGIADRSGVKAGDVITAIDGQKLSTDGRYNGETTYRALTVIRGGQNIPLVIRYR